MNRSFWKNKNVFLTGHTGFKGAWLSLWLEDMGALVSGYSLAPNTKPSFFELASVGKNMNSHFGDIRDLANLQKTMTAAKPDIVLHLAAQPLVRESYLNPVETYATNVMGTVHFLECIRSVSSIRSAVVVTSDKCYDNKEWPWSYRENEPMGGYDPYSNSKGCSELVTSSYRSSFFNSNVYESHRVALGSARAGNVIGGGDWAKDRLVPDILKSFEDYKTAIIRNPNAIRPWQHVLEPLSGYLTLAQNLFENGPSNADAWNFGPSDSETKSVEWIVQALCKKWGNSASYEIQKNSTQLHEAFYLKLDSSKARAILNWHPKWTLDVALQTTIDWHQCYLSNKDKSIRDFSLSQIADYEKETSRF